MRKTFALLSLLTLPLFAADDSAKLDSSTLGGLRARSIGPAVMGGRIAAIDATADSPSTIYVGAASGGVWKSTDGGTSFKPVFDEHTQSIGAIAIDKANPSTVWAGTGESCVRNSVSVGTGVYKTTDAGSTWTNAGLAGSEHIAGIAIDPKKSDTVFVCATGHAWNANEERGVFRTDDGGKTWKKVLYVDANTGCSDISMDPGDSSILYAGMWDFRRQPDNFRSGGPGSALYRSKDGGETWHKLTNGLPKTTLGRIAVAVAPSRPSTVYAVVESKNTALYRSDDLGEHWQEMNNSFNVQVRPFYFAHVVVDPTNHMRVYKPGYSLTFSDDGGKTFSGSIMSMGGAVHPDHHALWINPKDPNVMFAGTDGGVYQSFDKAQRWRFLNVLPVSQFYHVNYDMAMPYNVYGGLQDNGTWMAPSQFPGGVSNHHWRPIGGGDGFAVVADPNDEDTVYVESQGGRIVRFRRSTGENKEIYPFAKQDESKLRFNWNTPIYASPTQKGTIYIGSQYLMRSRDRGDSWERISPDLTTNDPSRQKQMESGGVSVDNSSAENYTTIITISESVKNANVIWVGTDDGNVQLTRDGGKTWTNVAANVKGVPPRTWVSRVEASHFDENTAYATFDGHRTGDMKPYVHRTRDGGKTWEALATADVKGFAHVVREDLVNRDLLFLGTELGLYLSVDGGKNWAQFKENFPPVPVNDVKIHQRDGDAIIGTHGRGIYIIDDITPLRALNSETLSKDVAFLASRPSKLNIPAFEGRMEGDDLYSSGALDDVASISYYLKKRHVIGDSKIEIYDADGKLLQTLTAGKRRGINRVDWAMRMKAPKMPAGSSLVFSGGAFYGPRAAEGKYTVKLIKGKETYATTLELVPDPRATYTAEDRTLQQKTVRRLYDMLADFTFLTERVRTLRDQANARAGKLSGGDKKRLGDFATKLDTTYRNLVATREGGWLSGEEQLRERIGALYGAVNSYDGRPTDSQIGEADVVAAELAKQQTAFDSATKELAQINRTLSSRKLETLTLLTREEWEKKESGVVGATSKGQFREMISRWLW
ncbi:MAG TPA: glycosyl hydrolase [Thermoanaerobaculia bacterium]|nr:glycosyl hydrolase [Thermoanaerobaculia bacterium]